jgi:hypothetical protein
VRVCWLVTKIKGVVGARVLAGHLRKRSGGCACVGWSLWKGMVCVCVCVCVCVWEATLERLGGGSGIWAVACFAREGKVEGMF